MIELLKIRENQSIATQAANWFHQKWGIPLEAYQESILDRSEERRVGIEGGGGGGGGGV